VLNKAHFSCSLWTAKPKGEHLASFVIAAAVVSSGGGGVCCSIIFLPLN
jgi:hypothetical protein